MKSVCEKRESCSCAASTMRGWEWPTLRQPTPPVKSMNVLPSTSVSVAPRPSAVTIGWTSERGAAITRSLRSMISFERGPGSSVRISIDFVTAMREKIAQ